MIDLNLHHQLGKTLAQHGQRILQVQIGRHHAGAEIQLTAFCLGDVIGLGKQPPGTAEQFPPAGQQLPPGGGEHHRTGVTVEQAYPEIGFQRLNAAAEGGLRQVGPLGRTGEVQLLTEQHQMTDSLQVY
ncbi:hypothetical protein D3C84_722390 [compost metagenome]